MSDRTVHEVQQGETHTVLFYSPLGSTFTATVSVPLYRLPGGINSYSPRELAETYTTSVFAGDSDEGPGWYCQLSAAETAALDPGVYVAQPKITYSSPNTDIDKPIDWIVIVRASA